MLHRGSSNKINVAFGGRHATKSRIAHTQRRSSTRRRTASSSPVMSCWRCCMRCRKCVSAHKVFQTLNSCNVWTRSFLSFQHIVIVMTSSTHTHIESPANTWDAVMGRTEPHTTLSRAGQTIGSHSLGQTLAHLSFESAGRHTLTSHHRCKRFATKRYSLYRTPRGRTRSPRPKTRTLSAQPCLAQGGRPPSLSAPDIHGSSMDRP
jgi:hypothetical protein